jgi:hypothetical protein
VHAPRDGDGGMPAENKTLLYLILLSLITPFLFLLWKFGKYCFEQDKLKKAKDLLKQSMDLDQYIELQNELFPFSNRRNYESKQFSVCESPALFLSLLSASKQVVGDEDDDGQMLFSSDICCLPKSFLFV